MTDIEDWATGRANTTPETTTVTTTVRLIGTLVCRTAEESAVVTDQLPRHVALTRAEPGCDEFEVTPTEDPLVWRVEERFSDADAFRAHQARVAASAWGQATAGIERRYQISGRE
ncbi:putative quinol monooxygenase [Microlunatus elymi]|uniref:putative quinol monooxygenase n=1 Tax=Microlunatus elymi TaxID=2596828 RepID=UPI001AEFB109|nr:antibiotic biosynthesis monooxygenase [Microlunatus elymi]